AVSGTLRPAPAHEELAVLAARDVPALIVDHARLEGAEWAPERARGDLAGLVTVGVDPPGLRHAPDFDEGEAEALFEARVQLGLDAGAQAELHVVRPVLRHLRLIEEQRRHDAQIVDDRRLRRGHVLPPTCGAEALGLSQAVRREN